MPKVWGGRRLASLFETQVAEPVGEAWLVSDHPISPTPVANGPLAGLRLGQALQAMEARESGSARFPLLMKLIESCEPLSVQVHPDDAMARELEGEPWGKSEAWYILESSGGHVGLGFGREPPERSAAFLLQERMPGYLQRFEVAAGDYLFVPGGEVHYIGPGVLLAEVQQSSDLTYRIHDWGRSGRELHTDKAARALSWQVRKGDELRRRGPGPPPFLGTWPFSVQELSVTEPTSIEAGEGHMVLFPLRGSGRLSHAAGQWAMRAFRCWVLPKGTVVQIEPDGALQALLCSAETTRKPR